MIITIASGKGGTGKTTVAANLAVSLERDVCLLDCDVEEPNTQLFLQPEIKSTKPVFAPIPQIDEERCTGCGKCVEICRFRAITLIASKILTFPALCHGCGGCFAVCPEDAVSETGRELGVIHQGQRGQVDCVIGRLRVGEAMSPPLIQAVREHASLEKITLIDAPPGTSCPVIAAMRGVDFILLVTEPTPFGLHDLRLTVEAVKTLGIPQGLVINRAGMGDSRVHDYAADEGLPILLEIPFDRAIAEAYSKGRLVVEEIPEWQGAFRQLYADIEKLVE